VHRELPVRDHQERACVCLCVRVQRRTRRNKTAYSTMKVLYGRQASMNQMDQHGAEDTSYRQRAVVVIAYPPSSILPTFKQASSVSRKMNPLFDVRSCRQLYSMRLGEGRPTGHAGDLRGERGKKRTSAVQLGHLGRFWATMVKGWEKL
jgi:hypothetical protein